MRAAFLPNSRQLLIQTQSLELWDSASGKRLKAFALPQYPGVELDSFPAPMRNDFLMAMCRDTPADKSNEQGLLVFWNLKSAKLTRVQRANRSEGDFAAVALSPDGRTVVVAHLSTLDHDHPKSPRSRVRLWDARSGKLLRSLRAGYFYEVYFSPDGQRVLVAGSTDAILFDLKTNAEVRLPDAGSWGAMAFSPDGHTIAALDRSSADTEEGSHDGIRWFDAQTGRLLRRVRLQWSSPVAADVNALCYSRDGQTLIVAGGNRSYTKDGQLDRTPERGEVLFYGAKDGKLKAKQLVPSVGEVLNLALSSDGKTLATVQFDAQPDGAVRIWRLD